MPKQQNKKPKTGSPLDLQVPEADIHRAQPIDMQFSGVTEAEYDRMGPGGPVGPDVTEYLRKTYPRLDETQNILKLLYAILREIVTWRLR